LAAVRIGPAGHHSVTDAAMQLSRWWVRIVCVNLRPSVVNLLSYCLELAWTSCGSVGAGHCSELEPRTQPGLDPIAEGTRAGQSNLP